MMKRGLHDGPVQKQLRGQQPRPELSRDRGADTKVRKLDHNEAKLSLNFQSNSARQGGDADFHHASVLDQFRRSG
jgi:hypothetical protein